MIFALVAMVMMTMSANAQSDNNNGRVTFDRLASYLKLRENQIKPTKIAMAQLAQSMRAYYQLQDTSKAIETWEKIKTRHEMTMMKILSNKQYNKYVKTLDLTVKNASERMMDQQLANK